MSRQSTNKYVTKLCWIVVNGFLSSRPLLRMVVFVHVFSCVQTSVLGYCKNTSTAYFAKVACIRHDDFAGNQVKHHNFIFRENCSCHLCCVADHACCSQVDCYSLSDCKLANSDRCTSSPVRCAVGTSSSRLIVDYQLILILLLLLSWYLWQLMLTLCTSHL